MLLVCASRGCVYLNNSAFAHVMLRKSIKHFNYMNNILSIAL